MTDQLPVRAISRARSYPLYAALSLLAFIAPFFFFLQLTHDAAWQMWISRQLLHGANLYTDIIEINPPLWFWMAVPLSWFSHATGLSELHALVAFFICCIFGSLILVDRLLPYWPGWQRLLFLLALVFVVMPPGNFCQREDFALITSVPYVLLIGARKSGIEIKARMSISIGCFAAVGFALKPQFGVVPIFLELWLRRSLIRPETITLAVLALTYGLSVVLLEPDFITNTIPLVRRAYGQFGDFHSTMLLPTAIPFAFALLARPGRDAISGALLVAALTFYLVFVWQMKGFAYQAMPAMGMLVLAVVASACGASNAGRAATIMAAALAVLPNLMPYRTPPWADVPRGSSYAALSVAPRAGWPLVEERGLTWPLRAMSLWMAPGVGDEIHGWVARDLECNPPTYLLVDDRTVDFTRMFSEIVDQYVPLWHRDGLTFMKISRPISRPLNCRPPAVP